MCMKILSTHNFEIKLKNYQEEELKILVEIEIVKANNSDYYQLTYSYNNERLMLHNIQEFEEFKPVNNELVLKNSLTEEIFKYLIMDYDDLCKLTGTITPLDYKKRLLLIFLKLID